MEDLDDLFTDQLNDQLNDQLDGDLGLVPVTPSLPGLAERLDELRLSGCSQKIAWSRMGAVAYITSDGLDVRICSLQFRAQEGVWTMNNNTDPMLTDCLQKTFKGRELVHLSFNPIGTDLLIISNCGKVAICTTVIAINRLIIPKLLFAEPEDNSNAVVGSIWLNYKRPFSVSTYAAKRDNEWLYGVFQQEAKGPHHPESKSAFITITRGGTVGLCYMGKQDYLEIKHELDGVSTSTDLLTHASLCQDKDDTMLLVVTTVAKQLRLYSMKIDWQNKSTEQQHTNLPVISTQHLTTVDFCAPSIEFVGSQSNMYMITPASEPELSHLELIPRKPENRSPRGTLPIILAVFSYVPGTLNGDEMSEPSYSILARWELAEEKPSLDATFMELNSKNTAADEMKDEQFLKKVEDIRVERVVIQVHQTCPGLTLSIAYSDGTVEFRDRNLALLPANDKPDIATGLSQLGFSFTDQEHCLYAALSPNACAKVSFGKAHEPKVSSLHIPLELVDANGLGKIAAAWTLQNTVAETSLNMGNSTNDDLIMVLYRFLLQLPNDHRQQLEQQCLKESYKALQAVGVLVDATPEKIMRFPPFARCLSLQAALGYYGEKTDRSLGSKVATILMNMRFIAASFGFALAAKPNSNVPGGVELDINRPETLQYMTGLVSWMMTLADYITDQLFELNRILNIPGSFDADLFREQATKSPVIPLILLSMSRSLLHYNVNALRRLAPLTGSPMARTPSPLAPYYANLASTFSKCIATPPDVDGMLTELDRLLKATYADLSEADKQQLELRILVDGEIPEIVMPALQQFLNGVVESTRRKLSEKEADFAFKDFNILCIGEDSKSRRWRRQTIFDGVRKIDLGKKKIRTRTCLRCGTVMEDVLPTRGMKAYWMYNLIRCCICGGHWITDKLWWIKSAPTSVPESNGLIHPI